MHPLLNTESRGRSSRKSGADKVFGYKPEGLSEIWTAMASEARLSRRSPDESGTPLLDDSMYMVAARNLGVSFRLQPTRVGQSAVAASLCRRSP